MVKLIESVNSSNVNFKKLSVDGIQNTIKYEITCNIRFDRQKRLTIESELQEAVQLYGIENEDIEISLKSVSDHDFKLNYIASDEDHLSSDTCVDMVNTIIQDCEHLR